MRIIASLFAGVLLISLITSGCSKSTPTQVDTVTVRDTLTKRDTTIKVDTLKTGPAFVRFISFLAQPGYISLTTSQARNATSLASASPESIKQFLPIRSDTALTLYGTFIVGATPVTSTFVVPNTYPQALITIALFQIGSGLNAVLAQDTALENLPPAGFAYLRLINGVSDYPTPDEVNAFVDSLSGPPLFKDALTQVRKDVRYQEIANYVLVPMGEHTIWIAGQSSGFTPWSSTFYVNSGGYYTARLTGSRSAGDDKLSIDNE